MKSNLVKIHQVTFCKVLAGKQLGATEKMRIFVV